MSASSYDLTKLDPASFEHMVNFLALKVLGSGHTGFGPGSDGGRDGYFEGEAPYPSSAERWSGRWYIQAKFHAPHLSTNPQKWLLDRIKEEIAEFQQPGTRRVWPDNWIIATNIDPSGTPETGVFDQARKFVESANPNLSIRFHIWGGRKILDLLAINSDIANYYSHFVTPGHVLSSIFNQISDSKAHISEIIRYFVVTQFNEQQHTKLEQAGSTTDNRPGVHRLFTDIPYFCAQLNVHGMAARSLAKTVAKNHQITDEIPNTENWKDWQRHPSRSRVWFVKGGPGQGKSTFTQYICQTHRAALMLGPSGPQVHPNQKTVAEDIKLSALQDGFWPAAPRVPAYVELKDYAQWYGNQNEDDSVGVLSYLASRIGKGLGLTVLAGTLKRAFSVSRWLFIFDGLDEVPGDVKDAISSEVITFIDDVLVGCLSDTVSICTSRPQGYSGQLAALDATTVELSLLSPEQALACALPVLKVDRSEEESQGYYETLSEAISSPSIQEIMTTPLQAHIMAVVVRDGGKPPERKWQLFTNFYQVIKKREANRKLPDKKLSKLLLEGNKLLKDLHNRLGFELHSRAETREGARTSLNRKELAEIVFETVSNLQDSDVDDTVETLMEATTERLVLVSTPETSQEVRFDIRPLQEFFAAEYIYESVDSEKLASRLRIIAGDSHWREVMHFLLSALIENARQTELAIAVEILTDLNEHGDHLNTRALSRRMALGGVMAARLLQEGVLDQDKRVRQSFRKCFDPLLASTDLSSLLSRVDRNHSRQWLLDVLIDSLLEKSEPENIGSASILAWMLPDSHSRLPYVVEYFSKSSLQYRVCVYRIVAQKIEDSDDYGEATDASYNLPKWTIMLMLGDLLSESWTKMGADGLSSVLEVLRSSSTFLPELASYFGIQGEYCEIAHDIVCGAARWNDERRVFVKHKSLYGIMEARYYRFIGNIDCTEWPSETWEWLKGQKGYLGFLYNIFRIHVDRTKESVERVINMLGDEVEILSAFPEYLRVAMSYNGDTTALYAGKPPCVEYLHSEDYGLSSELTFIAGTLRESVNFSSFTKEHIDIALFLLGSDFAETEYGRQYSLYAKSRDGGVQIVNAIMENRFVLFSVVHLWGKVFLLPNGAGDAIRAEVAKITNFPVMRDRYARSISHFRISLPEESSMLPHILMEVIHSVSRTNSHIRRKKSINVKERLDERLTRKQLLGQTISKFVEHSSQLLSVAKDTSCGADVRGAASAMYLLHPDSNASGRADVIDTVNKIYDTGVSSWFPYAVAEALHEGIASDEQESINAIGILMQKSRWNFSSRLMMDGKISEWREISRAPVQRHHDPDLWR
ncbi:MAG TPA: hypothetical protein VD978_26275 [Azospirillum sp.]|nr:hypothetical protein [Azospirillum sp.]